ncbi:MAG: type II toxin-antitoxin system VapC family toxin [Spirochaetaceae bacterium]|jgi:predicted nucleic acid-binding protein|nr:type II toxin-antitoxin system VapC family toxin [Spirochaetaceae bacterium]
MHGLTDGKPVVFDTNFVITLLHNRQKGMTDTFDADFAEKDCFASEITEIELLSFPGITEEEEAEIGRFFRDVTIIPLNREVKQKTIAFRRATNRKLPDSIIAATALLLDADVVSDDGKLLNATYPSLRVIPIQSSFSC